MFAADIKINKYIFNEKALKIHRVIHVRETFKACFMDSIQKKRTNFSNNLVNIDYRLKK